LIVLQHIGDALRLAFDMFWQVLWPLSLGFLLSAVVEAMVSRQAVSRLLGRDTAKAVVTAAVFGAASSSCSYAAVAVARTLFRKGATLGNAIVFEFASTNLVFELGLVLLVLLGWQFLSAELAGGVVMVVLIALVFRLTLSRRLVAAARAQSQRGLQGRMEGHAAMDMSLSGGSFVRRLFSRDAFTSISHHYFMGIYSVWTDLVLGFLIAGALGSWVPDAAWSALFLSGHGAVSDVWGAFIGPLIAMLSFVCSVGNIPLAAVLWRGGISFGGVIAFIFADLIILPILDIYRRYYGTRVAGYLFAVSYATMAASGLLIGWLFGAVGAVPLSRAVTALIATPTWNYDTFLDIAALLVTALLLVHFVRTGGVAMLRAMNAHPSASHTAAAHGGHRH
jgi:uncharacterized membrane protein YraQ (UPF0718 family)